MTTRWSHGHMPSDSIPKFSHQVCPYRAFHFCPPLSITILDCYVSSQVHIVSLFISTSRYVVYSNISNFGVWSIYTSIYTCYRTRQTQKWRPTGAGRDHLNNQGLSLDTTLWMQYFESIKNRDTSDRPPRFVDRTGVRYDFDKEDTLFIHGMPTSTRQNLSFLAGYVSVNWNPRSLQQEKQDISLSRLPHFILTTR